MTFNFHWIEADLAIGGRIHEHHYESLVKECGVTHIVDLRAENCDDAKILASHQIGFLHLPTPDLHAVSIEMLNRGVEWVNQVMERGGKVLVHCEHGIGRSVLLVWCVLVSRGRTPTEALERVKRIRAQASPSPEQIHAFLEWSKLHGWFGSPAPQWQELASIAYRHLKPS